MTSSMVRAPRRFVNPSAESLCQRNTFFSFSLHRTTMHPACIDVHPLSVSPFKSWHNPRRGIYSLRRQRRPSQPKPPRPKRTCTSDLFQRDYLLDGVHSGVKKDFSLLDLAALLSTSSRPTSAAASFTRNSAKMSSDRPSAAKGLADAWVMARATDALLAPPPPIHYHHRPHHRPQKRSSCRQA